MEKKPFGRGRGRRNPEGHGRQEETHAEISGNETIPRNELIRLNELLSPLERLTVADSVGEGDIPTTALKDHNEESLSKQSESKPEDELTESESEDEVAESKKEIEDKEELAPLPKTKMEAAQEFRMDAVVSPKPIPFHFFCCFCGCPAGHDCYTCIARGHPVCRPCRRELKIQFCPYVVPTKSKKRSVTICGYKLVQTKSAFRKFMFKHTKVGCMYRSQGCKFEGPWNAVKKHQKTCEHANANANSAAGTGK